MTKRANPDRNYLKKEPKCDDDLMEALYESYLMARRGKTSTEDEQRFEAFWFENLENLCDDILMRRYKPSRSKTFVTHTPVDREIFAAPFRDRITHHLLYAITMPWWDKQFIYDSYSCRVGKGTDFGVQRMQKFMRQASRNCTQKAYIIKCDISGYFMSMNREELYKRAMDGLERQFPNYGWQYELCKYAWHEVIFDNPVDGVRRVGPMSNWEKLPKNKSLFNQPDGVGIVIGNLTSQLLSNILLNEFDWYMKRILKLIWYGRYVDDFYFIVLAKDLKRALKLLKKEIPDKLAEVGLKLHPKKIYIQEVSKGCPYLGKMVKPFVLLPGERFKRNAKQAFRNFANGHGEYETIVSYLGMGQNMATKKYFDKIFDQLGQNYRF